MSSDKEAPAQKSEGIRLDWSGADAIPVRPANVFWLHPTSDSFILSIGQAFAADTTASMDQAEVQRYLSSHGVKVHGIVRLSLSPAAVRSLKDFLPDLAP